MHLESESEPRMVCVSGNMRESQQKFQYNNRIGFGSSCDEYYVNVDGFTATSEKQKENSRRSEVSKKCAKLSHEVRVLTVCLPSSLVR